MGTKIPAEHKAHAPKSVRCAVVTVSDTRTVETDESGQFICSTLRGAGHEVVAYEIVKDEVTALSTCVNELLRQEATEAVLLNGGTGVARRDVTVEVVESLLEKRLEGFGELFRFLSFEEIGSAAMMSRAVAGVALGTVLFAMPGSPAAVHLAMERLILPELPHLRQQLAPDDPRG